MCVIRALSGPDRCPVGPERAGNPAGLTDADIDRPYLAPLIAPAARERLAELMAMPELVSITERIAICRDPKDDKFLELAVNGKADVIVSGDGI